MLQYLYIRNFAIIEEIRIDFAKGLNIITGETGAGKSILIGALSYILGERADSSIVSKQRDKCVLESSFDISKIKTVIDELKKLELYDGDELIIRREISAQGKSRVFINDIPSTLQTLQPLAAKLIDLHRQFDTIDLQLEHNQLNMLDEIANHVAKVQTYQNIFLSYKKIEQTYKSLLEENELIKQELDYLQFQYSELEAFKVKPNEIEDAEKELTLIQHSEAIKAGLQKSIYILNESSEPILPSLKTVLQTVEVYANKLVSLQSITERLKATYIELKDINDEIEGIFEHIDFNEDHANYLLERVNEGNRLLTKHRLKSTEDLIQLQIELSSKIEKVNSADESAIQLKVELDKQLELVKQHAIVISDLRQKAIPGIVTKVNALLFQVGMPNAKISIDQKRIAPNTTGIDSIEFLFDANKTEVYQSISKVASGGELSRLMLCIKSLLAKTTALPSLVFDEIDTGISGETAIQVGQLMKELSSQHQLICITHLPQIASKANAHFYIYKHENESGSIQTSVKKLNDEERVDVLSEMLSGKNTDKHSKELVRGMMK